MSGHRRVEYVPPGVDITERMTLNERLQHVLTFSSFILLALTGLSIHLPRGFLRSWGIASPLVFEWRGYVHRGAGILLMAVGLWHLGYIALTTRGRWQFQMLLPRKKDWEDMKQMFRHFRDPENVPKPEFGWYSYIEKVEYLALVWGTFIMAVTGLILWVNEYSSKLLLDIAVIVHRYEAVLAVLAIAIWHCYHVHFAPDVFPMSRVWITGREPETEPDTSSHGIETVGS